MAKFMKKPKRESGSVWLCNPEGRVVHVIGEHHEDDDGNVILSKETVPEYAYAMHGNGGWRFATPEEVEKAKADADKANVRAREIVRADIAARRLRASLPPEPVLGTSQTSASSGQLPPAKRVA